ncbi:nucleotidyltransferase domain-containing protein [candidate division TA06 bacterium]|uniref:Nucleotidyltransferase domain-containing protein n=1 Tax=candidate division TA06 bacterium TaxID=2250710 RepID=A0A933MKV3_UNCT6|nr:nucleotidyltransferase domain-containing protein [candidate division TA06 bacterium]
MDRKAEEIIKKIAQALVKGYQPEKIILFGSYAYGEPNSQSDIDLLIIKETEQTFFKRLLDVRRLVSEIRRGYPFEPLVFTPEEIEARLKLGDPIFAEIFKKGEVIYAK